MQNIRKLEKRLFEEGDEPKSLPREKDSASGIDGTMALLILVSAIAMIIHALS